MELIVILLLRIVGYACAEETHEQQPLRVSCHPAKVVPRRVLPITPDMAGEVEVVHRAEGRVKKDTLLLRINPEELALDEQELHQQLERNNLTAETEILQLVRQKEELEFISKLPPERRMYVVQHLKAEVDERAMALLERKIAATPSTRSIRRTKCRKSRSVVALLPARASTLAHAASSKQTV